jgi:hypothetical protein
VPVSWASIASTWARPGKDNKNTSCTSVKPTLNGKANWVYKIEGTAVTPQSPVISPEGNVIIAYSDEQRSVFPDGKIVTVSVADGTFVRESPWGYVGQILVTSTNDFFISGCSYFYSWSHFMSDSTHERTVDVTYPLSGAPCDHNGNIIVSIEIGDV